MIAWGLSVKTPEELEEVLAFENLQSLEIPALQWNTLSIRKRRRILQQIERHSTLKKLYLGGGREVLLPLRSLQESEISEWLEPYQEIPKCFGFLLRLSKADLLEPESLGKISSLLKREGDLRTFWDCTRHPTTHVKVLPKEDGIVWDPAYQGIPRVSEGFSLQQVFKLTGLHEERWVRRYSEGTLREIHRAATTFGVDTILLGHSGRRENFLQITSKANVRSTFSSLRRPLKS
jgi:hypothetical protein